MSTSRLTLGGLLGLISACLLACAPSYLTWPVFGQLPKLISSRLPAAATEEPECGLNILYNASNATVEYVHLLIPSSHDSLLTQRSPQVLSSSMGSMGTANERGQHQTVYTGRKTCYPSICQNQGYSRGALTAALLRHVLLALSFCTNMRKISWWTLP